MLRLVYSNRAEELVSDLAERVRTQQERDGALVPVRIVVPNAAVEQYVRQGIARERGIAANLEVRLVTRFAGEALGPRPIAFADAFEAMALTLLLDDAFLASEDMAPVRAYVGAGKSPDGMGMRRVQLAGRVGHLFEQYAFSRGAMLDGWVRGRSLGERHAEVEGWQRRMWLAMFGVGGLGRARGVVPLHEAIATTTGHENAGAAHVFGFAHFARAFHDLFARLARSSDVVLYSMSPCEGFWEDFDSRDPLPLQLWARPGREHVRALNAAAAFDHEERFVEPVGSSILARLQRDWMHREAAREPDDVPVRADDESILFLEHASVRRELEAVASEIWSALERDEALRFDDIAVLIPDGSADAYLPHVGAVFGEAHDIPHQMLDLPSGGLGGVTEAVRLVLSLALGRFTRHEVLSVVRHPCVCSVLDGVDPARWLAFCDGLGVVHGADREDHAGTYIERDILHWDQGLRRLALGAFMAGDASGERTPFETLGEAYVPHEVAASELHDAAGMGLLVRSLVADARFVQGSTLAMKDWAALLAALAETYVVPRGDGDAEELTRCLRSLRALGSLDLGDAVVPYRVALELARARLTPPERGRSAEGVLVARFGSARPMPFRIVFACGMGEGKFPSSEAEDPLDLRWTGRAEGDVTQRERDKYAFLEVILGTRDRLLLSHVSRDPLTGDPLSPASVVEELRHALAAYGCDTASLVRRHPLRRWDSRYFPDQGFAHPARPGPLGTMRLREARAEAQSLALRRSAERSGARIDRATIEARAAGDPDWAALASHLRIPTLPARAAPAEGRLSLSMYAVVRFLDFPLQGWARFRLGLDEMEQDDALAREDEPFETSPREETLLLRAVFRAAGAGPFDRAYDEVARERELRGTGPTGVFAQGERALHLEVLQSWSEELERHCVARDALEVHRFGRAGEQSSADHAHPAVFVDVDVTDAQGVTRMTRVEINGRTRPIGQAPTAEGQSALSVTLAKRGNETREDWARAGRRREVLHAFVDHAMLSASGVAEGRTHGSLTVLATPDKTVAERCAFAPMSRDDATVWLRSVVRELLTGQHAYFFPSEAVFLWQDKGPGGPISPFVEDAHDLMGDGDGPPALRSTYGPIPRTQEYPLPDEDKARAMVEARFATLFEKWRLLP
ncbi:MAG TPA: exodeoxyribonuclease V subunit gamma [Polyangiaceae bacterium]